MVRKNINIEEAFRFGWEAVKRNFGFLLLAIFISGAAASVPGRLAERISDNFPIYAAILIMGGMVLGVVVELGLLKIIIKIADGKKAELSDLFSTLPLFFNFFFASLIYGLLVFLGLLFFIVPGIILAVMFWPYEYLIVDKGMSALGALEKSAEITAGLKWRLFLFMLAAIGINILGAMFFLVGLFVTIPVTMLAAAFVYRQLISRTK